MSLFSELRRRNVFRVGIAYVLIAWVGLQGADFALDLIGAPDWVIRALAVALAIGLPIAAIFAWAFELTPEGLKRESEVDRTTSIAPQTGRKLDRVIIVFLAAALAVVLAERWLFTPDTVPQAGNAGVESTAPPLATTPAAQSPTTPADQTPSIAVLPFVNMSADPEQEYFSDGLAEELLNRLAQREGLRVAARTSSFQFKGQNLDVADIGQQLKVDNVLEGSVRKAGNRLRVTAQLIKVEDGFHLWSETYERELDDVFAIQDDISASITRALATELGVAAATQDAPTETIEAYEAYLRGRFFVAKRGEANILTAIEQFQRATELDPSFAEAWSALGFSYALLPSYGGTISAATALSEAHAATERALALDANNPECYVTLGRVLGAHEFRYEEARAHFDKARALAPNSAQVANFYGDFLTQIGDFDAAVREERRAIELDPLAAVHYSDLAFLYVIMGENEAALELGQRAAQLAPDSYPRLDALITALIVNGRYEEARKRIAFVVNELDAVAGFVSSWNGYLAYFQGDRAALEAVVRERLSQAGTGSGFYQRTQTAFFLAALGDMAGALEQVREAQTLNEYSLTWPEAVYLPELISEEPDWLAFWDDPELKRLMDARRSTYRDGARGMWRGVLPP